MTYRRTEYEAALSAVGYPCALEYGVPRSERLLERGVIEALALRRECVAVDASGAAVNDDGNGLGLGGHGDEQQQGGGDGFHRGPAWPSAARLATRGFTGRAFCR